MPPTETDTDEAIRLALTDDLEADGEPNMRVTCFTTVVKTMDLETGETAYFRITDLEEDDVAELGLIDWGMMSLRQEMAQAMRDERG